MTNVPLRIASQASTWPHSTSPVPVCRDCSKPSNNDRPVERRSGEGGGWWHLPDNASCVEATGGSFYPYPPCRDRGPAAKCKDDVKSASPVEDCRLGIFPLALVAAAGIFSLSLGIGMRGRNRADGENEHDGQCSDKYFHLYLPIEFDTVTERQERNHSRTATRCLPVLARSRSACSETRISI